MKKMRYTQDVLQGRQVIEHLAAEELPEGYHSFWFRPQNNGIGQSWHLPVIVFRGDPQIAGGPQVMITAGVHGDELNGGDYRAEDYSAATVANNHGHSDYCANR